jgi:prepilin-type N-terminal cleavage/methylation domain-containing protein
MQPRQRQGLTLVELMVALAISTMIAAAALAVAANLPRTLAAQQRQGEPDLRAERLRALLDNDLAHSYRFRVTPAGVELEADVLLDARTLAPEHVKSILTYEVRTIGETPWLVRTQRAPEGKRTAELVCGRVHSLSVAPLGQVHAPDKDGWTDLPEAMTFHFDFDSPDQKPLELTFNNGRPQ